MNERRTDGAVNTPAGDGTVSLQVRRVGNGTMLEPGATVAETSVLGTACRIEAHAVVGASVRIGDRVTIGPGAFVGGMVEIGDEVVVGPNAAFVPAGFDNPAVRGSTTAHPTSPTVVRDGASIGANATVLGGVVVGVGAVVGAGSVVTRDVPPHAIVAGAPARIVGYQPSAQFTTTRRLRASRLDAEALPMSIGRVQLFHHPIVEDLRGFLSFGETPTNVPFVPHRYFLVFGVPSREVRGEHAHLTCHELLVCVQGEIAVAIDDGADRAEVILDRPDVSLHLPPMVWARQSQYSPDAVLLVLASHVYEADDYIRDYDEFCAEVGGG